jgi:hypothetical protein
MKTCSRCKVEKPRAEFANNGYCKPCNREYGKENYQQNKERYFAQAKKRDEQLDRLIVERKSKPCGDCGVQYPPYVMDFDHLEGEAKKFNISHMRRRRMAFEKIEAEMDKCEVVCSNCHRERTNKRNPSTRYAAIAEDF